MTLLECIKEKGLSRYSLSKISGVPWDTLSKLCCGEICFEQCSKELLSKLSEALGTSVEELVLLETGNDMDEDGRPRDKKYLETGLPESLQHSLDEFIAVYTGRKGSGVAYGLSVGRTLRLYQCLPVGRADYKGTGRLPAGKIPVWRGGRGR